MKKIHSTEELVKVYGTDKLVKIIAEYPTLKAFSSAVGVKYQVVQQWLLNGIPPKYCPEIEKLMKGRVMCEDLCFDVDWAYLRGTQSRGCCDAPTPHPELDK